MKEIILLKRRKRNFMRDSIVVLAMMVATYIFTVTLLNVVNGQVPFEKEATPKGYAVSAIPNPISPQELSIPIVDIYGKVEEVGISVKGAMMPPSDFKTIGWYRYGVKPGEVGNAYLVGHLDNAYGLPGVFKNLTRVVEGDDIYISDTSGKQLRFKVRDTRIVSYDEGTVATLAGETTVPRIVLITCYGSWIPESKTYTERLMVSAELVD